MDADHITKNGGSQESVQPVPGAAPVHTEVDRDPAPSTARSAAMPEYGGAMQDSSPPISLTLPSQTMPCENTEPLVRYRTTTRFAEPEADLLLALFREQTVVTRLARAPGGWRTLSEPELEALGFNPVERGAVLALQELTIRSYPELPPLRCPTSEAIGRVYSKRLGGLVREVMLALALDARENFIGEVEIAAGGAHGFGITAADVLRPLIRIGASTFILIHNHPAGDPRPSDQDIATTRTLAVCAEILRIPLVDHIIIGARGGGYLSLLEHGYFGEEERTQETEPAQTPRSSTPEP